MSVTQACDWSQAVTWTLVVIGWFVVHKTTIQREQRRERRDVVNRAVQELLDIEHIAASFHTAHHFDSGNAEALTWRTNRVIRSLQRKPLSMLQVDIKMLAQLRRSITLKNMDASSFSCQPPGSQLLKDIRHATDQVIEQIEKRRDETFA